VSTDGSTRDPRAELIAAVEAVATAEDLELALGGVLAATSSLQPAMAAIHVQDPDRPALQVVATRGFDDAAREQLAADAADPAHPFAEAAAGRIATFDREGTMADGSSFVGAYLPLVVTAGGVEVALGALGLGWAAPHQVDDAPRRLLEGLASLAAVAVDRARLSSTASERSDWFERMAHTDPLTGLANERTVGRILELELARAGRQGSRIGPPGGYGRADRWRRVRPGGTGLGRDDRRAPRAGGHHRPAGHRRAAHHGVGRRGAVPGRWRRHRCAHRGRQGRPGTGARERSWAGGRRSRAGKLSRESRSTVTRRAVSATSIGPRVSQGPWRHPSR
jgi:hypothetical protein